MHPALPNYPSGTLADTALSEAAPGHRFGLYYAGWNADFSKPGSGAAEVLNGICKLPAHSSKLLDALVARQQGAAEAAPGTVHSLPCVAASPFATGLGNEHPLENGFAFLTPYGLPYLPGSGVKGVIRKAAEELAGGEWGDAQGWDEDTIRALFGPGEEDPDRDENPSQGALRFWDVFPQPPESARGEAPLLVTEIMTPHHGEYYQGKHGPHTSEQPTPIPFLAVAPGARFAFHVEGHAGRLPENLRASWQTLLDAAFAHAGKWLGFGAKTAVGYGRMKLDESAANTRRAKRETAEREAREAAEQQQREKERAALSPFERSVQEVLDARPKDQPELKALFKAFSEGRWQGDEKREIATRLQAMMKEGKQWREKSEKKKPEKDEPYQMTLTVLRGLA
jgi:CRISPR-associated protein Cmr6